jgi:hypothetical protein
MQGTPSDDYVRKLDELDRLLNDPDVPMRWEAGKPFPTIGAAALAHDAARRLG